jgi:hypothetical protein
VTSDGKPALLHRTTQSIDEETEVQKTAQFTLAELV